jgi:hypothetical protein
MSTVTHRGIWPVTVENTALYLSTKWIFYRYSGS